MISNGVPRRLLTAANAGEFDFCTSAILLAELLDVLGRQKFATRLKRAALTPADIVLDLRRVATVVSTPTLVRRVIERDPDDDHGLAAAITCRADLIASGDKRDLLPLGSFEGIAIVTANEALKRIAVQKPPTKS